ncbi:MAG: TlpA family protein disulfide reductase [Verrucomicrobiae bacterium]|jgi:thiol-disulfide isomerase/thioredoxin|nr:TlpA family protein disulfide reductase [Verrucomicrobiae bacterium]
MNRLILFSITGLALCLELAAAPSPNLENSPHRFEVTAMHGRPAPDWDVTDWHNTTPLPIESLKGKIIVLDFWATHCAACLAAVPAKNELAKKLAARGVVLLGICLRDGGDKLASTIERHGIRYPVALDANGLTAKRFHVDSYPDYYVIDRAGRLRWGDIDNRDLEKAVDILLAETN